MTVVVISGSIVGEIDCYTWMVLNKTHTGYEDNNLLSKRIKIYSVFLRKVFSDNINNCCFLV